MFEEIAGLPLHPLAVHAPVVLVPLLVLAALAYVLLPRLRPSLALGVAVLAVLAPLTAVVAKLSGDAFRQRKIELGQAPEPILAVIDNHRTFGTWTMWATLALGVLVLALLAVGSGRRRTGADGDAAAPRPAAWLTVALTVLVLLASAAALYYVFRTGDSGARMIWEGQ
jgi:uncharacterized membrane protein